MPLAAMTCFGELPGALCLSVVLVSDFNNEPESIGVDGDIRHSDLPVWSVLEGEEDSVTRTGSSTLPRDV